MICSCKLRTALLLFLNILTIAGETFIYSGNGTLTSLIDSFADGNIEKTYYVYENNVLKRQETLNQKNHTCDVRFYPNENTTIKRWYMDWKPYRFDTSVFEKENVKLEYYGIDYSGVGKWHYRFLNQFDLNGNLMGVQSPNIAVTTYTYNNRNLLVKKQEEILFGRRQRVKMRYFFEYKKKFIERIIELRETDTFLLVGDKEGQY